MTNLSRLRKTITLAEDLTSIVGTMKTLAAVNIRQFDAAAAAIAEYIATVELGLQVALRDVPTPIPSPVARTAWVILGSDQGLCGAFNERITTAATGGLAEAPGRVLVVGHRVARRLEDLDIEVTREFRTPSSVPGVTDLVLELLPLLSEWRAASAIDAVNVLHNAPRETGGFQTTTVRLLPLDPDWLDGLRTTDWDSRARPTTPHATEELFGSLVREWLFARLYLAGAASLAAENAARLLATQAASQSLSERLITLRSKYRRERQQSITEELLDLHR